MSPALAAALAGAAAVLLVLAMLLPFVHARFDLALPGWIPNAFDLHERIRTWLIERGRIPVGDQYLLAIIRELLRGDQAADVAIGVVIGVFSVIFPGVKILLCAGTALAAGRLPQSWRRGSIRFLEWTSKWSMADVFIVAMLIVFFKAEGFHFRFELRPGIFAFGAAAILSSLAVGAARRAALPALAAGRALSDEED